MGRLAAAALVAARPNPNHKPRDDRLSTSTPTSPTAQTHTADQETSAYRAGALPRTLAYYASIGAIGLFSAILGPSLPGLSEQLRVPVGALGSLFLVRSLGGLIGSYLGGKLFDRTTGHTVMALALLLLAGLAALLPITPLLWLMWLVVFMMGIGESTLDVGSNTMLIWTFREKVAPFMNGLHFFFGVGAFISPLILAWSLRTSGQISLAFWVIGLCALPVAAAFFFLKSPPREAAVAHNNGLPDDRLALGLIALLFFLYVGAEVAFGGWVYTYAITLNLGSATSAAFLTSIFWGMLTIGRLLAIPISTRLSPRRMILIALSGCLGSVMLITLIPGSPAALWAGAIGLGFSMAPFFPTLLSLAERRMEITGRVTGLFFIASNAGGMTLPWLAGLIFQSSGPLAIMLLILSNLMLAMIAFALLIILVPSKHRPVQA
jgi:MFS transporter, FHS family, Na+ dependent glucose transporter 1